MMKTKMEKIRSKKIDKEKEYKKKLNIEDGKTIGAVNRKEKKKKKKKKKK